MLFPNFHKKNLINRSTNTENSNMLTNTYSKNIKTDLNFEVNLEYKFLLTAKSTLLLKNPFQNSVNPKAKKNLLNAFLKIDKSVYSSISFLPKKITHRSLSRGPIAKKKHSLTQLRYNLTFIKINVKTPKKKNNLSFLTTRILKHFIIVLAKPQYNSILVVEKRTTNSKLIIV